jgi:hypothetical protein
MMILGSVYFVDDEHFEVITSQLSIMPPPLKRRPVNGTLMCLDLDETSTRIEDMFPNHTQKATLLLPPPSAMVKYVDGNQEGFIEDYNYYLEYEPSVQEFISSMLYYLHMGGNILIYTPSCLDDDTIWLNTLRLFFFTRYGITIGTSITDKFAYDVNYDQMIDNLLYERDYIDIFDYIHSCTYSCPDKEVWNVWDKVARDLYIVGGPESDPIVTFITIKNSITTGVPIVRPAVYFG